MNTNDITPRELYITGCIGAIIFVVLIVFLVRTLIFALY
jgi:hypothetical protein